MWHCKEVRNLVFDEDLMNQINISNKMGFQGKAIETFQNIMVMFYKAMDEDTDESIRPWILLEFLKSCDGRLLNKFCDGRQHDAHEFLVAFMDALHEDLNTGKKIVMENPEYSSKHNEQEAYNILYKIWNIFKKRNNSKFIEIFYGLEKNTITCDCGFESITFGAFSCLQIPIRKNSIKKKRKFCDLDIETEEIRKKQRLSNVEKNVIKSIKFISLQCIIKEYSNIEVLSDKICQICKNKMKKKLELFWIPKNLIIVIKRFQDDGTKFNDFVRYPVTGLDLSSMVKGNQFCEIFTRRQKNSNEYLYDLETVINHSGTNTGGHYTVTIKHEGTWFEISDTTIIPQVDPVSPKGYILFYKRV